MEVRPGTMFPHATIRSSTSIDTIDSASASLGTVTSTSFSSTAISTHRQRFGPAVQRLDQLRVTFLDDPATDLQRRRQLAALDRELVLDQPDLLRELVPCEALQPVLDLLLDLLLDTR